VGQLDASGQSAPLISMKGSLLIRSMVENVGGEKNWSVAKAKSEKKAPEKRLLDRWININSERHLFSKFGSAD
jgi:hypothetical protein